MRAVFMGTPSYAAPVLEALVRADDVEIAAVVTPPDRPGGRGRNPMEPPVKSCAVAAGLPVLQPPTLRSEEARQSLSSLAPDVIVVAAYGRILPPYALDLPPGGCLNLHPSLLPLYRGPSPVVTAILDGAGSTGVSLMLLDQGMDTGPVIASSKIELLGNETAGDLTERLFRLGADLLLEKLAPWMAGELTAQPQDDDESVVTRKVEREDGRADWSLPASLLERQCRAYTPWPGLYTQWDGKHLKLLETFALESSAAATPPPQDGPPGLVVSLPSSDTPLGVTAQNGVLGIKSLQLEGRRPTAAADFLRGFPNILGARL